MSKKLLIAGAIGFVSLLLVAQAIVPEERKINETIDNYRDNGSYVNSNIGE